MKKIRGVKGFAFILIFYIAGVFATVLFARMVVVFYYAGVDRFEFLKEVSRAGEIGVKIGGLVALITWAGIAYEKYKKHRGN